MNRLALVIAVLLLCVHCAHADAAKKIRVAVVTGGHGFEEAPFLAMFEGHEDIEYTHVRLQDQSEIFEDISEWPYDVMVLFNMTQKISDKRRANFLELLDKGIGVVALHHAIAAFWEWPEFRKIVGARYYLKETVENGVTHARSQYSHDEDIKIHVEDADHRVTAGLSDFEVNDETYKGYTLEPDNHILLTTDHPKSQKEIGWARTYRNARVCFFQMGHGPGIYSDDSYRRLVVQAIRWVAEK